MGEEIRFSVEAQNAQAEYDAIVAKYKDTDKWMKAPNGKPTNLNERQWVQVHTPSFKRWFGDWEKAAEVYTIVDIQNAPFSIVSAAIEWVKDNGVIGVMTNEETGGKGEINVSVGSIREMLNPRQREKSVSAAAHFAALTKLREIIRESKVVESHPDYKKGADGKRSKENGINPDVQIDVLYGAIHFGDDVYRVKTRIKRYSQPSETLKAYSYQVSEIEVLPGTLEEAKSHTLPTDKTSITGNNLLQRVLNINGNLILEHSKVVDENGEPLVVYHGTDAKFNVFDRTKTRANMDIQGMFFSPWDIDAQGYGSNVRAFFLNIKNPADSGIGYSSLSKYKGQNNAGVKAREELIARGFDGVNNDSEEYIAFEPNQIKSATDNVGTFDPENPDVWYSVAATKEINKWNDGVNLEKVSSTIDSVLEQGILNGDYRIKNRKKKLKSKKVLLSFSNYSMIKKSNYPTEGLFILCQMNVLFL